jgi:hypothetical protein
MVLFVEANRCAASPTHFTISDLFSRCLVLFSEGSLLIHSSCLTFEPFCPILRLRNRQSHTCPALVFLPPRGFFLPYAPSAFGGELDLIAGQTSLFRRTESLSPRENSPFRSSGNFPPSVTRHEPIIRSPPAASSIWARAGARPLSCTTGATPRSRTRMSGSRRPLRILVRATWRSRQDSNLRPSV